METVITANIAKVKSIQPTTNLRFYDGVLQQEYQVITYEGVLAMHMEVEWQDVVSITSMPTPKIKL